MYQPQRCGFTPAGFCVITIIDEFVREFRPVVQLVEHRSPKPNVGGSSPSWPASIPGIYRVLALIPAAAVAALLAVWTQSGAAFWNLVKQARLEIYKVVWPTRSETTQTTLIVVAVVFLMAIVLWLLDMFFGWLASLIIS